VLARASSRPETFGGWHFLLLDSDEVNAFAAPGGFVFVTRGLYATCATEEQLAAVLAHEISHVTLRHGLGAIKNERLTEAFTILAPRRQGVLERPARPADRRGSRQHQRHRHEDDRVRVLAGAGIRRRRRSGARRLARRLQPGRADRVPRRAQGEGKKGDKGFFSTHPQPGDRLAKAASVIKSDKLAGETDAARTQRFAKYALK